MVTKETTAVSHCMTQTAMRAFVQHEADQGASQDTLRRFRGTLKAIYDHLPEDKFVTKERLLSWRKEMEDNGYASITILNYVKCINRYLDYVGCSAIRFNKGKAKDITGMVFGYLTAMELTGATERGDHVWRFQCRCGKTVELPATRVLTGNTLSCGCLKGARLKETMKCIDGTSLVMSMTDKVESARAISGYIGVTPKRDKWQAYIKYKGVHHSLGCYSELMDAVRARRQAKELVMADAQGLLDFYAELESTFPRLPNKRTEPKREFKRRDWVVNDAPASAAIRSDNTSGYPGVTFHKGKWEAKICYKGIRYRVDRCADKEAAIAARKEAESLLDKDPQQFIEHYINYPKHGISCGADK